MVPIYLLLVALVIIACVLLSRASNSLGIPMLLAFIVLGMLCGTDGLFKLEFSNFAFADKVSSIGLIFIMFYGGFCTNWRAAKPAAPAAVVLSSAGVILTAALVGVFCALVLKIGWLESFLIGAIISSTDAASVFSILRSKKLALKDNTDSLLELESGSNDPWAYMLTVIFLSLMRGEAVGWGLAYMVFAQVVYGAVSGVIIALGATYFLKKFKFTASGFDTLFVLAIAILAYAAPTAIGGNGYLSVYIVGIIMGNSRIGDKKSLVNFFDGVTGLMQVGIFFLLGLLSTPSRLPSIMLPALIIALFITIVARPVAIFLLSTPFKHSFKKQLLVSWAGLRGAASIVFAVIATIDSAVIDNDVFHIVFFIVLFSILIQGSLLPVFAKKLGMTDPNGNVMKTFTDYSDDVPVQFVQFTIPNRHVWNEQSLSDITLPPDTLVALLIRDGNKIPPHGGTVLLSGDTLILCAKTPTDISGVSLGEKSLQSGDSLIGKTLSECDVDGLVIMIQRGGKIVIPDGSTALCENDILVINHDR